MGLFDRLRGGSDVEKEDEKNETAHEDKQLRSKIEKPKVTEEGIEIETKLFEQLILKTFGSKQVFACLHVETNIPLIILLDNISDSINIINYDTIKGSLESLPVSQKEQMYRDVVSFKKVVFEAVNLTKK